MLLGMSTLGPKNSRKVNRSSIGISRAIQEQARATSLELPAVSVNSLASTMGQLSRIGSLGALFVS